MHRSRHHAPLICHCEERSDVAISGRQLRFCRGFPVIRPGTARLPRPLRGLAMTRQAGAAVHQRPCAVELSRTRRSLTAATGPVGTGSILTIVCAYRQHCAGRGMPLPYNGVYNRREYPEICSCQWRSLSAATDAIGFYVFIGTLCELEVPSRDCHVGLRPPRNDKPLAFIVLSIACTGRQHCAGRGMPLPYNAFPAALRKIPRSAFHVFFHKFSLSCA